MFDFYLLFERKTRHIESTKHTSPAERFWLTGIGIAWNNLCRNFTVRLLWKLSASSQLSIINIVPYLLFLYCNSVRNEIPPEIETCFPFNFLEGVPCIMLILYDQQYQMNLSFLFSKEKITYVPRKTIHFWKTKK